MFLKRFRRLSLGLVVLLTAGSAFGQVDHRVNRGNELGTGRALDSNPAVGGSGVNQPATGFNAGYQAHSIISGNYSGLARFHDSSPVISTNQFREALPSAGLSRFYGQSVGLQNIRPYEVSTPTYYFGRQETVSDLGYLRSGLNAPASSALQSPFAAPPRLFSPITAQPSGLQPTTFEPGAPSGASTSDFGVFQRSVAPPSVNSNLSPPATAYTGAASSSIFGPPRSISPLGSTLPGGLSALDIRLRDTLSEEGAASWENVAVEPAADPSSEAEHTRSAVTGAPGGLKQDEARFPGAAPGAFPGDARAAREPTVPPSPTLGSRLLKPDGTPLADRASSGRPAPAAGAPGSPPPDLGVNRFADLQRAIQTARGLGVRDLAFKPSESGGEAPVALPPADKPAEESAAPVPETARSRALIRRSDTAIADLASAARWAKELLEEPVTTFVTTSPDEFNGYMAQAEMALQAGNYYRAAGRYEIAHLLSPNDPLPLLGRGHALAAAGDYWSAANALRRGIELFPEIAAFRLDLVSLVGQPDIFDRRRADLEERLAHSEQYELRFLLGYLELYSGMPDDGLRNIEEAAKNAPPGSIIAEFPSLLLGRDVSEQSKDE